MPRKPNRRETQPYVPAGHGDESGEYRGYESTDTYRPGYKPKGDGKGKVVPKGKDVKAEIKTPPNMDDIKPSTSNKGDNYKKVNSYIGVKENSTYNNKQKEFINNFTKDCDNDCNQLIAKAQEATGVKYRIGNGQCSYGYNWMTGTRTGFTVKIDKMSLTDNAINDDYGLGSVFYHENGHLVDDMNSTGNYSSVYDSKKYNMTLSDMITQELNENGQKYYRELREIKKQMINDAISKVPKEEIEKHKIASNNLANLNVNHILKVKEIRRIELGDNYSIEKLIKWNETREKQLDSEYYNSDEYKKAKAEYDKNIKDPAGIAETSAVKEFNRNYGDISDMLDSIGLGITMGHSSRYWNRTHRGSEFFAEAFKTKATKSGKLLEYFPKSAEIFEEIIKEINK